MYKEVLVTNMGRLENLPPLKPTPAHELWWQRKQNDQ